MTRSTIFRTLLVSVALVATGCMVPADQQLQTTLTKPEVHTTDPAPQSNIVRVNKFFQAHPWLSFNPDGNGKINGVRFSVYLEGAERPKGVFGTGTMIVTLYRVDHSADGHGTPTKVFEWELPPEKAYPWRAKSESHMGWGYGLRLKWDDKLDLEGKQIAIIVKYVCEDGRVISSSRQIMKVPARNTDGLTFG